MFDPIEINIQLTLIGEADNHVRMIDEVSGLSISKQCTDAEINELHETLKHYESGLMTGHELSCKLVTALTLEKPAVVATADEPAYYIIDSAKRGVFMAFEFVPGRKAGHTFSTKAKRSEGMHYSSQREVQDAIKRIGGKDIFAVPMK